MQNAPLEDLPSIRVAYATLLSNNVSPPTSETRILNYGLSKKKHPQSVLVAFLNNQRFEINCPPV